MADVVGSDGYMAPECLAGKSSYKTDVFAWGLRFFFPHVDHEIFISK